MGATRAIAGWQRGAKRKRNGCLSEVAMLGIRESGREVMGMPRASKTSADPEAEEDALAPCWSSHRNPVSA
jgi:hypothetical protein